MKYEKIITWIGLKTQESSFLKLRTLTINIISTRDISHFQFLHFIYEIYILYL